MAVCSVIGELTMLNYESPTDDEPPPPRAAPAIALCLPGLFCWIVFFALRTFPEWVNVPARQVLAELFAPGFLLAVVTAIISMVAYGKYLRSPRPWYITANLIMNSAGLVFAAMVLAVA
jgi:hypothetical protein